MFPLFEVKDSTNYSDMHILKRFKYRGNDMVYASVGIVLS